MDSCHIMIVLAVCIAQAVSETCKLTSYDYNLFGSNTETTKSYSCIYGCCHTTFYPCCSFRETIYYKISLGVGIGATVVGLLITYCYYSNRQRRTQTPGVVINREETNMAAYATPTSGQVNTGFDHVVPVDQAPAYQPTYYAPPPPAYPHGSKQPTTQPQQQPQQQQQQQQQSNMGKVA